MKRNAEKVEIRKPVNRYGKIEWALSIGVLFLTF